MLRALLKAPRLRSVTAGERHATWLELFYDLIFVVAVAELAHTLSAHVDWQGLLTYLFLFVPVWWSWIGATFYATRFDPDDIVHRLLTLVQMAGVAALAVNVHDGLGKTSVAFALSYVAVRAVLIFQYYRAWRSVPEARPLINWYMAGFSISALMWLLSVFVPPPARFVIWAFALLIDIGAPVTARRLAALIPPHISHVPERMGLFIIIVLGESVAAVVRALSELEWDVASSVTALLGLMIAFSLWWTYFNGGGGGGEMPPGLTPRRLRLYQYWLYTHFFLAAGLAAAGVGVEHAVKVAKDAAMSAPDRWLICGAVAASLIALGLVHSTGAANSGEQRDIRLHAFAHSMAAVLVLFLAAFGGGLSAPVVVGLLALICATQVILDIREQIAHHETQHEEEEIGVGADEGQPAMGR
jgi:low temperature requirement protein LtrA